MRFIALSLVWVAIEISVCACSGKSTSTSENTGPVGATEAPTGPQITSQLPPTQSTFQSTPQPTPQTVPNPAPQPDPQPTSQPILSVPANAASVAVAGLTGDTCYIKTGNVYCFGENSSGGLGVGDRQPRNKPTLVKGLPVGRVTHIALSQNGDLGCAVAAKKLYCWGQGALSLGLLSAADNENNFAVPALVPGMDANVTGVSLPASRAYVIKGGALYSWGAEFEATLNAANYVPDPQLPEDERPTAGQIVTGLESGVTAVSGMESMDTAWHACALVNGGVKCWGSGSFGLLGTLAVYNQGSYSDSLLPLQVDHAASGVTSLSVGFNNVCMIQAGDVFCWGVNLRGELGNGPGCYIELIPTRVRGLPPGRATEVSSSGGTTCALISGAAYCWGENTYGEAGFQPGPLTPSNYDPTLFTPVLVKGLEKEVSSITVGTLNSCANVNGQLTCWGKGVQSASGVQLLMNSPSSNQANNSGAPLCPVATPVNQ